MRVPSTLSAWHDLAGRAHQRLDPVVLRGRATAAQDAFFTAARAPTAAPRRLRAASVRGLVYGAHAVGAVAPAVNAALGTGGPLPAAAGASLVGALAHGSAYLVAQVAGGLGALLQSAVWALACVVGLAVGLVASRGVPAQDPAPGRAAGEVRADGQPAGGVAGEPDAANNGANEHAAAPGPATPAAPPAADFVDVTRLAAALCAEDHARALDAIIAWPDDVLAQINGESALAAALRLPATRDIAMLIWQRLQARVEADPALAPAFAAAAREAVAVLGAQSDPARDDTLAAIAAGAIKVAAMGPDGSLAPTFLAAVARCAASPTPVADARALADTLLADMFAPAPAADTANAGAAAETNNTEAVTAGPPATALNEPARHYAQAVVAGLVLAQRDGVALSRSMFGRTSLIVNAMGDVPAKKLHRVSPEQGQRAVVALLESTERAAECTGALAALTKLRDAAGGTRAWAPAVPPAGPSSRRRRRDDGPRCL